MELFVTSKIFFWKRKNEIGMNDYNNTSIKKSYFNEENLNILYIFHNSIFHIENFC